MLSVASMLKKCQFSGRLGRFRHVSTLSRVSEGHVGAPAQVTSKGTSSTRGRTARSCGCKIAGVPRMRVELMFEVSFEAQHDVLILFGGIFDASHEFSRRMPWVHLIFSR